MDAPELAQLFLDQIFCHHGFPQAIVSDQGSLFISSFFTQLMKICGTKMKPSTAFHPQTDGLALAEFVFNNTLNSSTQQTPFFANIGLHPEFNITITKQTTNPLATKFTTRLSIIHEELQSELMHSNKYMSKYYD